MNKKKFFETILDLMYDPPSKYLDEQKETIKGLIHDELSRPENMGRTYPIILNEFALKFFLSKEAQKEGYGLEHVCDFLNWLESEMEIC